MLVTAEADLALHWSLTPAAAVHDGHDCVVTEGDDYGDFIFQSSVHR